MLRALSRSNQIQFATPLIPCGHRGVWATPFSLTGIDVISVFLFLSPSLPLLTLLSNQAALPFAGRKLRVSGNPWLHFTTASPEKPSTRNPDTEGFTLMTVAQTVACWMKGSRL
jgi:hypothetical protein